MSHEDRAAFNQHCREMMDDLKPLGARELFLATAVAEDTWRLSRARALEHNIFAIGMTGSIGQATVGDTPEVHAAACQARMWLAEAPWLQMLSLHEQRIRRSLEKNQKELDRLQSIRKEAHDTALEQAKLLAWQAITEGRVYDPTEYPATAQYGPIGFEFSSAEITRIVRREMRLKEAARAQQKSQRQQAHDTPRPETASGPFRKAA